jgi:hypothetical protein
MIITAATTNNRTNMIEFIKLLLLPPSYNETQRALAVSGNIAYREKRPFLPMLLPMDSVQPLVVFL